MDASERRLTMWWAILAGVTLVSFETGRSSGGLAAQAAVVAVLALAFAKAWIVIVQFMDVRSAPRFLQFALAAWTMAVAGGLIGLWLSA